MTLNLEPEPSERPRETRAARRAALGGQPAEHRGLADTAPAGPASATGRARATERARSKRASTPTARQAASDDAADPADLAAPQEFSSTTLRGAAAAAKRAVVENLAVAVLGPLVVLLLGFAFYTINDRFAAIDDRFAAIDDRFATIDDRFAAIDDRFTELERKMEARFAEQDRKIEAKFAEQDRKIEAKFAEQDRKIEAKFAEQDRKIEALQSGLHSIDLKLTALIAALGMTEAVDSAIAEAAIAGSISSDVAGPTGHMTAAS